MLSSLRLSLCTKPEDLQTLADSNSLGEGGGSWQLLEAVTAAPADCSTLPQCRNAGTNTCICPHRQKLFILSPIVLSPEMSYISLKSKIINFWIIHESIKLKVPSSISSIMVLEGEHNSKNGRVSCARCGSGSPSVTLCSVYPTHGPHTTLTTLPCSRLTPHQPMRGRLRHSVANQKLWSLTVQRYVDLITTARL